MQPRLHLGGIGGLQKQLDCFQKVGPRLFDRIALARDVELGAQRDVAVPLPLDDTGQARDLDLAIEVAEVFRVGPNRANQIVGEVAGAVRSWRAVAASTGLARRSQEKMERAFRVIQ